MYIQMLKNQQVTFVSDVADAEKYSPYRMIYNKFSGKWIVKHSERETMPIVAAGLDQDEAEACVIWHANRHIFNAVQKG